MHQKFKKIISANRGALGMCFLLLFALLLQPVTLEAIRLRSTPPKGFSFDFGRWPYPLHAEVCARLQELVRQYPKLARIHNIGKSVEGRDLLVMEITNSDTGPGESKPGIWMDGNLHPDEVTGRRYLRYLIERLLASYGKDPEMTRLVDTRTFYVMPILNPDAGERVLTRHPAWPGHKPSEHSGKDLDGDGYITRMRWKDDPSDQKYRYQTEGASLGERVRGLYARYREYSGEREPADFNRNWSAEWQPEEPGAGPFPFSQPEVFAVATFITSHKNIFFVYNIHSGGGARSYMVRPPMNHPDDFMPPEDNEFYVRLGAIWAALSEGGLMQSNYMSYNFNAGRLDEHGNVRGYGKTMVGFMNDWAYIHAGIHSISPEIEGSAPDYNGDGFIRRDEVERWHQEEKGGQYFSPWKPNNHPELGKIEIGGSRGIPPAIDGTCKMHSEWQYDLLCHIADLSPLLRIKDLTSQPISGGKYRVVATLQNQGFLATYVTRNALKIRRDYPINARIRVTGGQVVGGEITKNVGHIGGKLTYIRQWSHGAEVPTKTVEWTIKATGSRPFKVSIEAWAPKAGRDQRTITIKQ